MTGHVHSYCLWATLQSSDDLCLFYLLWYIHQCQEEVDDVVMMSMDEILTEAESGGKFTPDSIFACKEYVKLKGSPPTIGDRPSVEIVDLH